MSETDHRHLAVGAVLMRRYLSGSQDLTITDRAVGDRWLERRGGKVLDCLFADAWQSGATALEGRLEPALYEPLSERRCLLRYGTRALFHSRDPEVEAAMALGKSALTRLDGEWLMGRHNEPFT